MGTRYQGTPEEVLALDTYIKLVRATSSVTARIHRHLTAAGLSASQFGVLEALLHLGPLCQRDLAQKLLTSGGNITMVVDNLEKRDLVRRERTTEDRRFICIHLTETGQEMISQLFPHHVEAVIETMAVLTATQQEELGRLCRQLGRQEPA
ncbi:MAG: winged helix-turn-helix transcriptional regulator [Gemmatimonadaceae bacterium]|nr:winged helix-turn-helix transcriptional regulator [Gloeobacterales cyanobacterium ES-bin-141]